MPNRPWRDDEEDWSETGADGDDPDDDAIPCPDCGADIYADLDHCPRCGHWLTDADRAAGETGLFATRRVRLIAAALLTVFALGLILSLVAI